MVEVSRGKIGSVTTGLQLRHSSRNGIIATPRTDLLPYHSRCISTPFSRLILLKNLLYKYAKNLMR